MYHVPVLQVSVHVYAQLRSNRNAATSIHTKCVSNFPLMYYAYQTNSQHYTMEQRKQAGYILWINCYGKSMPGLKVPWKQYKRTVPVYPVLRKSLLIVIEVKSLQFFRPLKPILSTLLNTKLILTGIRTWKFILFNK